MKNDRRRQDSAALIRCEECRRAWNNPAERWQMYLTEDPGDEQAHAVAYCPGCAARESSA